MRAPLSDYHNPMAVRRPFIGRGPGAFTPPGAEEEEEEDCPKNESFHGEGTGLTDKKKAKNGGVWRRLNVQKKKKKTRSQRSQHWFSRRGVRWAPWLRSAREPRLTVERRPGDLAGQPAVLG